MLTRTHTHTHTRHAQRRARAHTVTHTPLLTFSYMHGHCEPLTVAGHVESDGGRHSRLSERPSPDGQFPFALR